MGDHSINHPRFPTLTNAQIDAQIRASAATIYTTTGAHVVPLFRFPYGATDYRSLAEVNRLGYVAIGWTVDTLGWKGSSSGITANSIVARVMASLRPGEIVLMHVGANPTDGSTLDASALPAMINAIRAAGYGFVTLDAILR